jgi:hypothetical protein
VNLLSIDFSKLLANYVTFSLTFSLAFSRATRRRIASLGGY